MTSSTLPRYPGDMQANFVGEQAEAWAMARPEDRITILAPHHPGAARSERGRQVNVERFRYVLPERAQRLAYPAMLPNIRRNPLLALLVPGFLVAEFQAARRLVARERVDLVYAHWVMPQGLVAWRLKRHTGIKYVLQNHSSDLAIFKKAGSFGRRLGRQVLRESTHFFCVNERQFQEALRLLPEDEREGFALRSTVLPMGVARPSRPTGAAGPRYDIGAIARLSRKKGLHLFIEAAEDLARKGIRPRIAIAGDGEERGKLESLVSQADITFMGFLAGAEKAQFFATVDRFVFPACAESGDVEGLPVALLEAMALGKPVLASRDTNIELLPEWPKIREAVTFVSEPSDLPSLERALVQLLVVAPAATAGPAEIMKRYRWERLIEDYITPIEDALKRVTRPTR